MAVWCHYQALFFCPLKTDKSLQNSPIPSAKCIEYSLCFEAKRTNRRVLFSWQTSGISAIYIWTADIFLFPVGLRSLFICLDQPLSLFIWTYQIVLTWLSVTVMCTYKKKKRPSNSLSLAHISTSASIRHLLLPCDYLKIVSGCRALSDPRWRAFTYLHSLSLPLPLILPLFVSSFCNSLFFH